MIVWLILETEAAALTVRVKLTVAVIGLDPPVLPVITYVVIVLVAVGVPVIKPVDVLKVNPVGSDVPLGLDAIEYTNNGWPVWLNV